MSTVFSQVMYGPDNRLADGAILDLTNPKATVKFPWGAPITGISIAGSVLSATPPLGGVVTLGLAAQAAGTILAGPMSGGPGIPTFKTIASLGLGGSYSLPINLAAIGALANMSGWLHNNGGGTFVYSTPTKADIGLGNVENTALSTWAGTVNITTLGTIIAGTWHGSAITDTYISSAATWSGKQNAYTILSTLGALANAIGFLHNDGAGALSWVAVGTGTVTSVTAGTGLTATTNPIVTTGTISVTGPLLTLTNLADAAGWLHSTGANVFAWSTPTAANVGAIATSLMSVLGDIIYEDASPAPARLAGNTTTTKKFLRQTGAGGGISAVPAWDTVTASDVGATTVGGNLLTLANPSAITFIRINADNTVTALSAASTITALGSTTVGGNIFALTNPSAITFLRINADNTVTALSDTNFRTAIGAGTGSGTVTSVGGTAPIVSSGGTTPAISITGVDATHAGSVPLSGTPAARNFLIAAATTGAVSWGTLTSADVGATTVGAALMGLTNPSAITFIRINADNSVTALSAANFHTALGDTTVGTNLVTLTNPSAITFIRINADNTVTALSDANFRTAIGAGTSSFDGTWGSLSSKPTNVVSFGSLANAAGWLKNDGAGALSYSTPTAANIGATTVGGNLFALTNPSAITFIRINADNTVTALSAANFITALGATTVGGNLFSLTNPSAITFLRINADNTVTALSDSNFRTAIGAGTGSGTVTSVSGTAPIASSGGTTPAISISACDATHAGSVPLSGTPAARNFLAAAVTSGAVAWGTIAAADIGATTAGNNLLTLTNPSAITFLRVNADNTVTALSAANFRTAIGDTTVGGNLVTLTNPSAITFIRINADNTVTALSAANFLTALGATTVGGNLFGLTNPSAITFIRINADNTVTALSDSNFRTAIGAGTSSFDGTWGSLSSKPTNVVSFGSLANAAGWLKNDGAGALSYSTPTAANIGATTVGGNLFTLTNPSAITFIRINADNTVTALSDSNFRTAIGAGTSSFDGTWGSLSGKPTNVVSFGSLANAAGWLHNDGAGALAYSTPTAANIGATTVGGNLFALTNPSAITFIRINADNTVTALSAANFNTALGATTVGGNIFALTNPSAITFLRINADNTVTTLSAANFVTALGATTVGGNFFSLTNPGAITFPRINADNSVSALSAASFLTAIGGISGNQSITLSGDVGGTGTTAITTAIGAGRVTLAMHADMATASLFYRKTAGNGAPEVNSLATLKTDLGLTGTNSGDQTITLTGNVTGSGTGSFATTIAANAVTLAMMATIANNTVLGNISGGAAVPSALTGANVRTICGLATTDSPTLAGLTAYGPVFINTNAQVLGFSAITGTSAVYMSFNNTGGTNYIGQESSAGDAIIIGAPAYALSVASAPGKSLCLGANGGSGVGITISSALAIRFNQYGAGALTTDSSGNITATSDERAKDIIGDFTTGLAAVRKLQPVMYHWKDSTGLNTDDLNVSLTAQDLLAAGITEAVFTQRTTEVVMDGKTQKDAKGKTITQKVDATYTVSDRAVVATLVNAIKELADQVDELKKK